MTLLPLDGNYIFSKTPWLDWTQLLFGLDNGYIDERGISNYICETLTSSSPPETYEIATIEPQDQYLIRDLLQSLASTSAHNEIGASKPWIFLLLSYFLENKDQLKQPLETVEKLYADFDYPEEIAPIVRYMPLPDGVEGSEERLYENWKIVLSKYEDFFSQQQQAKATNGKGTDLFSIKK